MTVITDAPPVFSNRNLDLENNIAILNDQPGDDQFSAGDEPASQGGGTLFYWRPGSRQKPITHADLLSTIAFRFLVTGLRQGQELWLVREVAS